MSKKIFISHSSADFDYAEQLCDALESSGISCWIAPRDIAPAMSWGEAIIQGIQGCELILLLMSANANESRHVAREIERGDHYEKSFLPIRLEDVQASDELSYFLGRVQWLNAQRHEFEMQLSSLVEHIHTLITPDINLSTSSNKTIWHQFGEESLSIVLGRFLARGSKTPEAIGYGDRKALIELRNYLQKEQINNFSVVYADLLDKPMLTGNLVLIGGTGANKISKRYIKDVPQGFTFGFRRGGKIWVEDTITGEKYESENMRDSDDDGGDGIDYGVISTAPNPFADSGYVIYVSGSYSYATWACIRHCLTDEFSQTLDIASGETREILLKVQVEDHKPAGYDILVNRPLPAG